MCACTTECHETRRSSVAMIVYIIYLFYSKTVDSVEMILTPLLKREEDTHLSANKVYVR